MDDRELQGEILRYLSAKYPGKAQTEEIPGNEKDNFDRCMCYLKEHELIDFGIIKAFRASDNFINIKISAKGIDFLADDGGLGAILDVVTIRIHPDSIKDIIATKIDSSSISVERKSKLKEAIKDAPSIMVTEALKRLTGMAFDHGPAAFDYLQKTFLGS
uniref:Uncharacterized protein n=1 Tax=Desulfovibrio sp. U5L TaxID=596152 RepID=I2Q5D6_9BACT